MSQIANRSIPPSVVTIAAGVTHAAFALAGAGQDCAGAGYLVLLASLLSWD